MTPRAALTTAGRADVEEYFELSGCLECSKLNHTPFLAFVCQDNVVVVRIIENALALLALPDDAPVMGQWRGEWKSDFFQFTVGQMRAYLHERAPERIRSRWNV